MSKRAYFGTDGIRGQANKHPMTAEVALRVGLAAGKLFRSQDDRRHLVVIGKDTRLSGYMIEPALVAGFASVGMDVRLFGPLPTPAVAMMTRSMRADLGVMISASHNDFADNGIKLFGPDDADDSAHEIRDSFVVGAMRRYPAASLCEAPLAFANAKSGKSQFRIVSRALPAENR